MVVTVSLRCPSTREWLHVAASGYLQYSYIGDPTGDWDGRDELGGYRRQQHLAGRNNLF